MTIKKTMLMAVLLLAGVSLLWVIESTPSPDSVSRGPQALFPDWDSDAVSAIEIRFNNQQYTLQRQEGAWRVAKPLVAAADQEAVAALLYAVDSLQFHHTIDEPELLADLARFGLDAPTTRVTLQRGEQSTVLAFGNKHPLSERRYLRRDAEPRLLLVDDSSATQFEKSLFDVRDKQLLRFDPAATVGIRVQRPRRSELVLQRTNGADDWSVVDGSRTTAGDTDLINRLLQLLSSLTAVEFIDQPQPTLGEYGLGESAIEAQLLSSSDNANPQIAFRVGEVEQRYYLQLVGDTRIYRLERRIASSLLQPSYYFRDKTPLDNLPIEQLRSVTFQRPNEFGRDFTIFRYDTKEVGKLWGVTDDGAINEVADHDKVSQWLGMLLGLQVLSYIDPAERPSTKGFPEASVELALSETGEQFRVYTLIVSKQLPAINQEAGDDAPWYGSLSEPGDVPSVPLIISSATWRALNKQAADFVASGEGQNGDS